MIGAFFKTAFSAATGFLGGIQTYLIVGVASFAIGAGGASLATYKIMHNANLAATAQQAQRTVRRVVAQDHITVTIGEIYANVTLHIVTDTNRRLNEVSAHVTPAIDTTYPVPCGFVRVYNGAAHGPVSDPAVCPDAAPSGVPLSDVAKTSVVNLGQYDAVAAQLTNLQDWIRQQQALDQK
jgi:hypothetical protein